MGDIYFITFDDGYNSEETIECNTRGEAEAEVDNIVADGSEIIRIIKGKLLNYTINTEISLGEEE